MRNCNTDRCSLKQVHHHMRCLGKCQRRRAFVKDIAGTWRCRICGHVGRKAADVIREGNYELPDLP